MEKKKTCGECFLYWDKDEGDGAVVRGPNQDTWQALDAAYARDQSAG